MEICEHILNLHENAKGQKIAKPPLNKIKVSGLYSTDDQELL